MIGYIVFIIHELYSCRWSVANKKQRQYLPTSLWVQYDYVIGTLEPPFNFFIVFYY